jgi:hypothetical protein
VFEFPAKWKQASGAIPKIQCNVKDGDLHALAKLKVAVIDDNVLVRNNLLRALVAYVPRANLLIRGQTEAECNAFAGELVERGVDLAIIDLHLDVTDEVSISGIDIAKQAKAIGFKGCMVIRSSDILMADLLRKGAPVHAAVDKTSDTRNLLRKLLAAWDLFVADRALRGT